MKRIAWLTDIHLSFVDQENRQAFVDELVAADPDVLLLGGDIGEARNVVQFLKNIAEVFEKQTFAVLGNHDFYEGSISAVRSAVHDISQSCHNFTYLTTAQEPIELTKSTCLIGHDGWADGREGDYEQSEIMLNDYLLVQELARFSKQDRLSELHRLGDEAAQHIGKQLELALPAYEQVFVLTHVPPFREACWYQGRISDDNWAPHFVCQAVGKAILDVAGNYPQTRISVLCGHTHSPGVCQPAPSVHVITGGATYGKPGITQTFDLPTDS